MPWHGEQKREEKRGTGREGLRRNPLFWILIRNLVFGESQPKGGC
jgi:hypothetical protein